MLHQLMNFEKDYLFDSVTNYTKVDFVDWMHQIVKNFKMAMVGNTANNPRGILIAS